ncbi:3575_t:CDS:1, partial [Rhizophagus irregularis]
FVTGEVEETNGEVNEVVLVINVPSPPPIKDSSSVRHVKIFHPAFASVNLLVIDMFECFVFGLLL